MTKNQKNTPGAKVACPRPPGRSSQRTATGSASSARPTAAISDAAASLAKASPNGERVARALLADGSHRTPPDDQQRHPDRAQRGRRRRRQNWQGRNVAAEHGERAECRKSDVGWSPPRPEAAPSTTLGRYSSDRMVWLSWPKNESVMPNKSLHRRPVHDQRQRDDSRAECQQRGRADHRRAHRIPDPLRHTKRIPGARPDPRAHPDQRTETRNRQHAGERLRNALASAVGDHRRGVSARRPVRRRDEQWTTGRPTLRSSG